VQAAVRTGRFHGYRISQLFSSKVDPGEVLREYRTTKFPDGSTTSRSASRGRTWSGGSMWRRSVPLRRGAYAREREGILRDGRGHGEICTQ